MLIGRSITSAAAVSGSIAGASPAAGFIGELKEVYASTALGSGFTIAQYGNICSLALTAGVWDVEMYAQSAVQVGLTGLTIALSTNSGNTTTDHLAFKNQFSMPIGIANSPAAFSKRVRVTISATTTYYLKANCAGAVGNVLNGSIIAVRIA